MVLGMEETGRSLDREEPKEGQIRRMRPNAGFCLKRGDKTPC